MTVPEILHIIAFSLIAGGVAMQIYFGWRARQDRAELHRRRMAAFDNPPVLSAEQVAAIANRGPILAECAVDWTAPGTKEYLPPRV